MAANFRRRKTLPLRIDTIVNSSIIFIFIFLLGSASFIILMSRIMVNSAGQELLKTVEFEILSLEAYVKSEIAIALMMADSPLIKRYFSNPDDPELEKMAFEEFAAYHRAFTANSVFWVNDKDKIFYSGNYEPYLIDPDNPDNYWYSMTLNETEIYNFNINFNPELNVTKLWINAPVFSNEKKAIGIVGTGINLSDFIDAINKNYSGTADIYFFNSAGEITGAKDIRLVQNKVRIEDELSQISAEILSGMKEIESGGNKYFKTKERRGVAVIGRIHDLDWYITAVQSFTILDSLKTGMTFLFAAFMIVIFLVFVVYVSKIETARAEAARDAVLSGIEYASRIQKNLLPDDKLFKDAFCDYNIIWKPRDIVGGDIYWIKNFEEGTVLCVCDCTGHGTPGALLTMLVVSVFEATVAENNCKDTAHIIWELEKRLAAMLNAKTESAEAKELTIKNGCDLAVLFIAKDGNVTSSSSRTHIFVCDGQNVTQIKGQKIYIGEGKIKSREEIKTVNIPANTENKFYIASDGLYEQPGGEESAPFGYKKFMKIILENHNESQSVISEKIWKAFEAHRGAGSQVDDFELISFKLKV